MHIREIELLLVLSELQDESEVIDHVLRRVRGECFSEKIDQSRAEIAVPVLVLFGECHREQRAENRIDHLVHVLIWKVYAHVIEQEVAEES